MRKNRIKLTLIIASLCGTCGSANTFGQDDSTSGRISSVGRIGDGGVLASATEASFGQDARPPVFRSNVVADDGMGTPYTDKTMRFASHENSVGTSEYAGSCGAAPCGTTSCNSGCSSVSAGWFESETLLWWPKSISGGPLVLGGTNPNATDRPSVPLAGGPNNPVGNDLLVGMRLNLGVWTDCNQNFGIGARGWGILSDAATRNFPNNGRSNGIAFFNASIGPNTPAADVFLVNVNAGGNNGANTGTIQLKSDVDLIAGEIYGRSLLIRDGNSRVDFLSGYTFARLDSELGIRSQITNGITDPILNGTVQTTQDTFGTKNQFHGGHIGLMNEVNKGRFSFSALGKVALGNMNQSTTISGRFTEVSGQASSTEARGLFAQNSNIGTLTRNQFTFLPEAGAKMKYQLGQAQLGIGYTLMVFPSVAMAGSQVDRNVDINPQVLGSPVAPGRGIMNETFFLHGLDLGMTFSF